MKKIWEVLEKNPKNILTTLLKNRKINNLEAFFNPPNPDNLNLKTLGIKLSDVKKIVDRIDLAKAQKEGVVIYGDYDADGVCATAILWESLFKYGLLVMPFIPDRFSEGYGFKKEQIPKLKSQNKNLRLIITIDNGIVAHEGIKEAIKEGIDVIVIDHHQKDSNRPATSYILHSTAVCGSALAWLFSKVSTLGKGSDLSSGLDLVAIGTIADQMPLIGVNRSLVKHGLVEINKTKRLGLRNLFHVAGINEIGTYEIGYQIAPRINASGRLTHAIDSLRLICTRNAQKAHELSLALNKVNSQRQKIVDEVLGNIGKKVGKQQVIVLKGNYHEGVIGLAAGKITEKYYRPSIVLSVNGKTAKASARSITGFDMIKAIRAQKKLIIEGGGHEMAAGFSIYTKNIEKFSKAINKYSKKYLTEKILAQKLVIDMPLKFDQINQELLNSIKKFEPFGQGNFPPVFVSYNVKIDEIKAVGTGGKHLKLKLSQEKIVFDAIWFNVPTFHQPPTINHVCDIAYSLDQNIYNGRSTIQLKIRDLRS